MGIQVVTIANALATNAVAASTAIDLAAAAQTEAGPVFPNVGNGNAVLRVDIAPGATPGAYDIEVQQSDSASTGFTSVFAIDEATVGASLLTNVTITKRYVRVSIVEATANAGTVTAWLLSA